MKNLKLFRKKIKKIAWFIIIINFASTQNKIKAFQVDPNISTLVNPPVSDSSRHNLSSLNIAPKKDVGDWFKKLLKIKPKQNIPVKKKNFIALLPAIGYTPETQLAIILAGNIAFYAGDSTKTNLSSISASISYTQNKQVLFPIKSNVWTKNNQYNWVGDYRYYIYPQNTYGLGGHTLFSKPDLIYFNFGRLYQTVLRSFSNSFYAGFGFRYDSHWNIDEKGANGEVTDFQKYGYGNGRKSVSSGLSLNLQYDNRSNSINPEKGIFANIIYRPNYTFLGSDQHWESLTLDFRRYIRFSPYSKNMLAFWNYNWLTLSGNPPYLDLPSTGWDINSTSGRGYIQGRYRGKNMLYCETEYRFDITRDALLGAVVFINAQSISEPITNRFTNIMPAGGCGLRIKLNKKSGTNLAIDYAIGLQGSTGLYFNIGEAF